MRAHADSCRKPSATMLHETLISERSSIVFAPGTSRKAWRSFRNGARPDFARLCDWRFTLPAQNVPTCEVGGEHGVEEDGRANGVEVHPRDAITGVRPKRRAACLHMSDAMQAA